MPSKAKKNYQALSHSDALATLATSIHKTLEKGQVVPLKELDDVIRHAHDLKAVLTVVSHPVDLSDPFLTEEPKIDVAKLPTVQVPVPQMEKSKEEEKKKSGFLGR